MYPPPTPCSSYGVPKGSLVRALSDAAARGVDVRVLIPSVSDVPVMPWVSVRFRALFVGFAVPQLAGGCLLIPVVKVAACYADRLLNAGARVFACVHALILNSSSILLSQMLCSLRPLPSFD